MCLTKPRLNNLLNARLARKNYLQISAFLSSGDRVKNVLQKKAIRGTTSKKLRKMADGTKSDLTLRMSISASKVYPKW